VKKEITYAQFLELARLERVLLKDRLQHVTFDALHLLALSDGMLDACNALDIAASLYASGKVRFVAFNGSDGSGVLTSAPQSQWMGGQGYVRELMKRGVPRDGLILTAPAMHTRGETDAFISLAKERGWRTVGCLTLPYHLPRVFCCMVKSMQEAGYWPTVWAVYPPRTDWLLPMLGSQARKMSTPLEEAFDDAAKLLREYIPKGFAAPIEDVLAYVRSRQE